MKVLISQSCPILCDAMDDNQPGSSVHGILRIRITRVGNHSLLRDFPDPGIEPGSPALQADSLPSEPPGKPSEELWLFTFVIITNLCDRYLCILIVFSFCPFHSYILPEMMYVVKKVCVSCYTFLSFVENLCG